MFITLSVRFIQGPHTGEIMPITCLGERNLIYRLDELVETEGVELVSYEAVNLDGSDGRAKLSASTRDWLQRLMYPDYYDPGIIDLYPIRAIRGHSTGKLDRVELPLVQRRALVPHQCCEAEKCSYCGQCHNAACSRRKVICELAQRDLMHRECVPLDEPGYEQVEAVICYSPEPQQKRPWWKVW